MDNATGVLTVEFIRNCVYTIRGQQVMLDSDLADIYGYELKAMNQQVKRNIERFPEDFMFQLTRDEVDLVKSQNVTSRNSSMACIREIWMHESIRQIIKAPTLPSTVGSLVLCFDVDCDTGLKVHCETVLKDCNFLNQAADQRLIKLCDGWETDLYYMLVSQSENQRS